MKSKIKAILNVLRKWWAEKVQKLSFRIIFYVVLIVASAGLLIGIDYALAGHYRHQPFLAKITRSAPVYYDYIEVVGQDAYVQGEDADIDGVLRCFKDNELVTTIPLTTKIDTGFDLSRLGSHSDNFTYNSLYLNYSYTVYRPYSPEDGTPVGYSISNVRNQYYVGEDMDTNGIIVVSTDLGTEIIMPLRSAYVQGFDTSTTGTIECTLHFEVGGVTFEQIMFFTIE